MRIEDYQMGLSVIGRKLQRLRERKGFTTCNAFAEEFQLPSGQYRRMEEGRVNLTLKSLMRVLKIHQLSLEEFLCDDVEKVAA
jgi:transcriptional regulator with XRE-family HTH domain